jgi:hypothetical protein
MSKRVGDEPLQKASRTAQSASVPERLEAGTLDGPRLLPQDGTTEGAAISSVQ